MAAERSLPICKDEILKLIEETNGNPDAMKIAPLKILKRAFEKAHDDYNKRKPGHGERWLFDIVRGSLICESEEKIVSIGTDKIRCNINMDEQSPDYGSVMVVSRLKNRFESPTPSGFRDINANVRVCVDPRVPIYHTCELHIHCRPIKDLAYQLSSHSIYEFLRTYFRGCVARML